MKLPSTLSALAASFVILLAPMGSWAQPGFRSFERLNLTPDQQTQVQAIRAKSKASQEELRTQMRAAKEQMKTLLSSNAPNDQLIRQHETLQSLHQEASKRRFATLLEIREILTPEQRSQLATLGEGRGRRLGKPALE